MANGDWIAYIAGRGIDRCLRAYADTVGTPTWNEYQRLADLLLCASTELREEVERGRQDVERAERTAHLNTWTYERRHLGLEAIEVIHVPR
jgi:hypothetical protein